MRVIGGMYRSRLLVSPPGTSTRPTSDRLRETLFNILGPSVAGSRFVDLFAGTGAVGIEAISRGASHTFFAENAPPALKALKTNLANLRIAQGYAVEDRGAMALLQRLLKLPEPVGFVYIDPPYDAQEAYVQALGFLGSPAQAKVMGADAVVMAEHASKGFQPAERYGLLQRTRLYKQGDTSVSFYKTASLD